MVDRRHGDRRDSERREFREQEGRRDGQGSPRRLGLRRFLGPSLLLLSSVAILFGCHVAVVAPRALAVDGARDSWVVLEPVMAGLQLPLLAYPSMGGPAPGPLSASPLVLDDSEQSAVRAVLTRLEALARRSPRVVDVQVPIATGRLLLGEERESRLAWESVLAGGDPLQRERALLGLGVVALRTSCRQGSQSDRGFAFEHALSYFSRLAVDPDAVLLTDALFNQAVALVALGRLDAAEVVIARLSERAAPEGRAALLRQWIESGAALSLLLPELGLPTIAAGSESSPAAEEP